MKSLRITKGGKVIPSQLTVGRSYQDDQDSLWEAYYQRHNGPTRKLSDLPDDIDPVGEKIGRLLSPPLSPEGLKAQRQARIISFMASKGRFNIGDWVTDVGHGYNSPSLTKAAVYYILDIQRDAEKVIWKQGHVDPCPFLLASIPFPWEISEDNKAFTKTGWVRWADMNYKRHLTELEVTRLVAGDDLIPHYIEQIKESLKASHLQID